ncbi:MAG: S41 family peptidase, partial [Phycisphaerales bacterium]|nr:S41 family peptidase [Phycisphaerales bacterium]
HTRGDFIGVGISIIKNKLGEIEVVTPLEDTPAFRHGVQPGDIIAKVDGTEIKDYSLNKVVDTITGRIGTAVTLTIRRDDKEIEFPLIREKVKIQSVKGWDRKPDGTWNYWKDDDNRIAYVRITNFQRNTAEDLMNVMSELQAKGLKGLVLDLRGNPGGLLDSAWQVSSLFLNNGDAVVSTKGRNHSEDQVLSAPSEGPYTDVPMVVLVDEASASASEIVSGALRDDSRATVIGERTFGKFSVQNLIPLSSSNAKLKITTARYYIPSGVSLHREPTSEKWGVEPQIPVPLVRWERVNVYQLRRDADLLGAAKPEKDKTAADEEVEIDPLTGDPVIQPKKSAGAEEAKKDSAKDEKVAGGDAAESKNADTKKDDATADAEKKDELPPLDQPDANNRPKVDPQMDTALLVMRIKLLAQRFPSLAAAERDVPKSSAQP